MSDELPDSPTLRVLDTAEDNRDAALALAQGARRSISILTVDLEPAVYDTEDFIETVKQLALSSRFAQIRILVQDPTRAVKEGHRLVELARRLSSFIEIRKPHEDYRTTAEAFLIADESGLLYRTVATRYEGIADVADAAQARDKLKLFNQIWQRSEPEQELRGLKL